MIAGPLPLRLVAAVLGKSEEELTPLIEDEDGLPVVKVNARTRPARKVYITSLLGWMNRRASGSAMTLEQLEVELERCQLGLAAKDAKRKASASKRGAPVSAS